MIFLESKEKKSYPLRIETPATNLQQPCNKTATNKRKVGKKVKKWPKTTGFGFYVWVLADDSGEIYGTCEKVTGEDNGCVVSVYVINVEEELFFFDTLEEIRDTLRSVGLGVWQKSVFRDFLKIKTVRLLESAIQEKADVYARS